MNTTVHISKGTIEATSTVEGLTTKGSKEKDSNTVDGITIVGNTADGITTAGGKEKKLKGPLNAGFF
jgi:hypothetical protein